MLTKKNLAYLGVENPNTMEELMVEMYGLKNIIKQAEEQISRLEQAIKISELKLSEISK